MYSKGETQPGFYSSLALGCFAAQVYLHVGGLTEVNFTDGEVNHAIVMVWSLTLGLAQPARSQSTAGSEPVEASSPPAVRSRAA